MKWRGWAGIAGYFLFGCLSLVGVAWGVYNWSHSPLKKIELSFSSAKAQTAETKPSATALAVPVSLPGPEDVAVDAVTETPPAPETEAEAPHMPPKRNLGILEGIIEDYDYKGQGKRDPFAPYATIKPSSSGPIGPVTELERYTLDQLRLVGIIWNVPKPRALFTDPNQKTYVVYAKTRVGRNSGYVAEIREGEVVVIEAFSNEGRYSYQPRIVKLQRE